jgi:hypothetical protein
MGRIEELCRQVSGRRWVVEPLTPKNCGDVEVQSRMPFSIRNRTSSRACSKCCFEVVVGGFSGGGDNNLAGIVGEECLSDGLSFCGPSGGFLADCGGCFGWGEIAFG